MSGHDISPLLRNPKSKWQHPAITTHGRGNHSVRTATERYIRYADGSEEYYDHAKDPYEWKNLAATADLSRFKKWLPKRKCLCQVLKKNEADLILIFLFPDFNHGIGSEFESRLLIRLKASSLSLGTGVAACKTHSISGKFVETRRFIVQSSIAIESRSRGHQQI